jgi:lycopene beta-cyclase
MPQGDRVDCILVGGGLANSLIALALHQARPDLRLLILERGDRIGGNHTWSFHTTDTSAATYRLLQPLIIKSWSSQEVRFPGNHRILGTGYNSVSSARLHDVMTARLDASLRLNADVKSVASDGVELADGTHFAASCVIDSRGLVQSQAWELGFQKFLGLEVELEEPCRQERPIIMDGTIPQVDGYRFMYTLPLSERVLLIEDTYYSNGNDVQHSALEKEVTDYAADRGWKIARVLRRETGILPIVLSGDIEMLWSTNPNPDVPCAGLRAVMFNPTTGYSLPDAARVAVKVARVRELRSAPVAALIREHSIALWHQRGFYRLLNRLLFTAAEPEERLAVMNRFYKMPESLIRRFYASELTYADKTRLLVGKPPINFFRALSVIPERFVLRA